MSQSISASKPGNYSLLSDNASPLERALERTLSQQLERIVPPFPNLRDAYNTPAVMLPYLATDRLVTYWKQDDAQPTKRKQVSTAQLERQLSGTRAGITLALDAIGYGCQIQSRYERPDLPPYTLHIVAWKNDASPVNKNLIYQLLDKLEEIKSTRDTLSLALTFGVKTGIAVAGGCAPPVNIGVTDAAATLWPMPDVTFSAGICGGIIPGCNISHLALVADIAPDALVMASAVHAGCDPGISVFPITARAMI